VNKTVGVPARDFDPKTNKMRPWPSPYILMVDRGDCTFVQKVCFDSLRVGVRVCCWFCVACGGKNVDDD